MRYMKQQQQKKEEDESPKDDQRVARQFGIDRSWGVLKDKKWNNRILKLLPPLAVCLADYKVVISCILQLGLMCGRLACGQNRRYVFCLACPLFDWLKSKKSSGRFVFKSLYKLWETACHIFITLIKTVRQPTRPDTTEGRRRRMKKRRNPPSDPDPFAAFVSSRHELMLKALLVELFAIKIKSKFIVIILRRNEWSWNSVKVAQRQRIDPSP